jgi:hypothetical protein
LSGGDGAMGAQATGSSNTAKATSLLIPPSVPAKNV